LPREKEKLSKRRGENEEVVNMCGEACVTRGGKKEEGGMGRRAFACI
jgi:hypothetical protein